MNIKLSEQMNKSGEQVIVRAELITFVYRV